MPIHIEIKTDLRVKQFLPILLEIENVKFEYEIDSTNYGEGYQLSYKNIVFRLFDSFRSEEAGLDKDFIAKKINWDQVFERVVLNNTGEGFLMIEIDRFNNSLDVQTELSKLISEKLEKGRYPFELK